MRKDYTLKVLKTVLLCSFSTLWMQDVSSVSCSKCEIKSFSHSCKSQDAMTVDPKSNVVLNCSINQSETALGMTWEQIRQRVSPGDDLMLQRINSTNGNHPCSCFRIKFPRNVMKNRFSTTTSPHELKTGHQIELKCSFKGWPRPRVVWFSPDGKPILNGTEGFYISEQLVGNDNLISVLHHPKGQEKHEGDYTCIGENNISSWSSKQCAVIEVTYICPWPKHPVSDSPDISALASSNVSLKCLVDVDLDSCVNNLKLQWHFKDSSAPLKNSGKYKIQERKTDSKCKIEFNLTIVNITNADEGKYSCHMLCSVTGNKTTDINVNVFPPTASPKRPWTTTDNYSKSTATPKHSIQRLWILLIIIAPSGVVFLVIFTVYRFVRAKRAAPYIVCKYDPEEGNVSNSIFISYSSKDDAWVNENLIPILDNNNISYNIHTRDFELGRPFIQNMVDSVYGSRKVLIVLSDKYLDSNFCREELHMAFRRELDTGDSLLILLLIEKLSKKKLPGPLRYKRLLDFEMHKVKGDWEVKLLEVVQEEEEEVVRKPDVLYKSFGYIY